jgi:hypothetical protein
VLSAVVCAALDFNENAHDAEGDLAAQKLPVRREEADAFGGFALVAHGVHAELAGAGVQRANPRDLEAAGREALRTDRARLLYCE